MVDLLLRSGCDVDMTSDYKMTPLQLAAWVGNFRVQVALKEVSTTSGNCCRGEMNSAVEEE